MKALQAKMRPHILYNCLNLAAELTYQNPADEEQAILDITDFSYATMFIDENPSLEQELELTRQYLHIVALRFGERLNIKWQLPNDLPNILLPCFLLFSLY